MSTPPRSAFFNDESALDATVISVIGFITANEWDEFVLKDTTSIDSTTSDRIFQKTP